MAATVRSAPRCRTPRRQTKRAPTAFEQRVYALVAQVPPGHVTTYAALARALGIRSPRAIGQALRRNPFAPRIPCHRVIASDGSIGGFCGANSGAPIRKKLARLAAEGVRFSAGRLAESWRIWTPPARFGRP